MNVLMGTVALEPNRWATIEASGGPTIGLSDWVPALAEAGFDGLEVWEPHLGAAAPGEAEAVLSGPLPVTVVNSYASFDDPDAEDRDAAAVWATRAGASGVKFNVGNDSAQRDAYIEHLAAWLDELPAGAQALCECHPGISIAEDPATAAAIFNAAGPPERLGAIVHTHESPDHLRARFDAYGERITHVHVNFLDDTLAVPRLAEVADRLGSRVELLASLGFAGTWTIEFVAGLLTDADEPQALVAQAAEDLGVLRKVLGEVAA